MKFFSLNKHSREVNSIISYSFVFMFFWFLYIYILNFLQSDMSFHIDFAKDTLKDDPIPGNFVLYSLIIIFSGFFKNQILTTLSFTFLLSSASTYRFHLYNKSFNIIKDDTKVFSKSILVSLSLLFVFTVFNPFTRAKYLGYFVPNVWHNSTTIFLFPFAILLFNYSLQQIKEFDKTRLFKISILVFLNIFIKPSFFFVWVSVYPLFILYHYRFSKEFWLNMAPIVVGIIFLALQYFYIYFYTSSDSSVIIAPFDVFSNWTTYSRFSTFSFFLFSIFFSFLFPLAYFILNFNQVKKNKDLLFTYACLIVSLGIFFILAEEGERKFHGNFYWQIVICVNLLFYQTLLSFIKDINDIKNTFQKKSKKNSLLVYLYGLHLLSGIVYIISYFITRSYC